MNILAPWRDGKTEKAHDAESLNVTSEFPKSIEVNALPLPFSAVDVDVGVDVDVLDNDDADVHDDDVFTTDAVACFPPSPIPFLQIKSYHIITITITVVVIAVAIDESRL